MVAAPPPCALVTAADVQSAVGAKPGKPQAQTLGLFRSCTYRAGSATVTIQTRQIDKGTFVKSAKANPGPVKAVAVPGATAFSAAGPTLLIWKNGTAVTVLVLGASPALPLEKKLAVRADSRLP